MKVLLEGEGLKASPACVACNGWVGFPIMENGWLPEGVA